VKNIKELKSQDLGNKKSDLNNKINFSFSDSIRHKEIINKSASWEEIKSLFTEFKPVEIAYNNVKTGKVDGSRKLTHEDAIQQSIAILKHERKVFSYFVGGHFEPNQRSNANLVSRHLIVLDIDKYDEDINSLEDKIEKELSNLDYVSYSTASHKTQKPSVRIVIKPSREIKKSEYKQVVGSFIETLSFKDSIDKVASTTPSQAMYLPHLIVITNQPENVKQYNYEKWAKEGIGEPLDVDEFKSNVLEYNSTIKECEDVQDKAPLILNDDEIKEYIDQYPAENLSYSEWLDVGFAMHYQYSGKTSGYKLWLEWSSKDSRYEESEGKEKWNSFKVIHQNPITFATIIKRINDISKKDSEKETINLISHLNYKIKKLNQGFTEKDITLILASLAKHCTSLESDYYLDSIKNCSGIALSILKKMFDKELKIKEKTDSKKYKGKIFDIKYTLPPSLFEGFLSGEKQPKTTIENFKIILEYYGISIRRNIISREEEIIIPGSRYSIETSEESNFTQLISLCEKNNLTKTQFINSFTGAIAAQNSYNPVLNCIKSKPWDGKSRIKDLYETIVTEEGFNQDLKELLLRKWLISAVAAVNIEEGFFSKGVLVFQSKQSVGKTSWFKKLAPEELGKYFKEGCHLDPTNKDSLKTCISKWIVELGEIDSTLKRDIAMLKAFISSDRDSFRVAYGRKDTKFMRRTVFCGSVNESKFLIDKTGNVRFWVIPATSINYEHNIDMQQLWAEIYQIYKSGENWWLDRDQEQLLEGSNRDFEQGCPFEEAFLDKYDVFKPNNDPGYEPCLLKGATELLMELGWSRPSKRDLNDMAAALRRLGAIERKNKKKFKVILLKSDDKNRENIADNTLYS
jgi:hypothetical protein